MQVVRFSAYVPVDFTPQKILWYSFMLEAGSTPGHSQDGRIMSMKTNNITIKKETREIPDCNTVPVIISGTHK